MKTSNRTRGESASFWLVGFLSLSLFLAQATRLFAQAPPGPSLPTPLASWSFQDTNYWTSDQGYAPVSFTNITSSDLGDGSSLVVETNVPAWLNYNIYEPTNGATNLTVATGSVTFWFGPGWDTTNGGPGDWAQLIDVGEWTLDSSCGYWGLSIDPSGSNLLFLAQDGIGDNYGLSAPISWTTNYFHFVAFTYSSTNVSLYIDGTLATNDPGGLSIWPDTNVLSGGVYFGSDTNGDYQAGGLFNLVATYDYPLDSNTVQEIYDSEITSYEISPWNASFMSVISSASPSPSSDTPSYNEVNGAGYLQPAGSASYCADGANADSVWITNVMATGQPFNDPNAAVPHAHGYGPEGAKSPITDPNTGNKHFPTKPPTTPTS
jgi:hypothetical protein